MKLSLNNDINDDNYPSEKLVKKSAMITVLILLGGPQVVIKIIFLFAK